jgi:SAM-dependent methyltransferase
VSSTYSDVDASDDPYEAVRWQLRVDQWPQVRAYKARILELVATADSLLDVGCGPGADVVAAGAGRTVGVDRSMAMCRAAASRVAPIAMADARYLPFPDACFGGVVADRVLQHVEDPSAVVEEMLRVLRPRGRLVVADPDQETLVIHLPGVAQGLADRVKRLRRDVGYRQGRFISSLPASMIELGMADVSVEAFPLALTDPYDAFGLPEWPRLWHPHAAFSEDELGEWETGVRRSRDGGFLYAQLYFVVSGVKARA